MNRYTARFFAQCPNNDAWVSYELTINTGEVIKVESILDVVHSIRRGYHEQIADNLLTLFGGAQVLKAHHHGVDIETTRPHLAHWSRAE